MPIHTILQRLLELEAQIEEALLVGRYLQLVFTLRGPQVSAHPRVGDLRAQETADHVPQVVTPGVAGARGSEVHRLQYAALEEERIPCAVPAVRQDLNRGEQPRPTLELEPQPVEPPFQRPPYRDDPALPAAQTNPPFRIPNTARQATLCGNLSPARQLFADDHRSGSRRLLSARLPSGRYYP